MKCIFRMFYINRRLLDVSLVITIQMHGSYQGALRTLDAVTFLLFLGHIARMQCIDAAPCRMLHVAWSVCCVCVWALG